jgi:Pvc16 N-terminal domain
MASPTVLRDIGVTVKKLLQSSIDELAATSTSSTATDVLSIFLYQVGESAHLRNVEPSPIGTEKMEYPPVTIDLHYMFTAYAQNRDTELMILGKLMQVFRRYAVLRGDVLQGALQTTGNDEIRVVPNVLSLDELNKIWSLFPNKGLKLSLSYMLTPVRIPSENVIDITRVQQREITVHSKKCMALAE